MAPVYIYPGSFSPPTYGHQAIIEQAASLVPELLVICSVNPDKTALFSSHEAKLLWQFYSLPPNVRVKTLEEFLQLNISPDQIIMIRGIRNNQDFEYEKKVAFLNRDSFQIKKFLYIFCEPQWEKVSSSVARTAAAEINLTELANLVAPGVLTVLVEKTSGLRHLFLVVGRTGSGKSTFLHQLKKIDNRNIHIETDVFNYQLRSLIRKSFPSENLNQLAQTEPEKIAGIMFLPWMKLLSQALTEAPPDSNVFMEVPYAFRPPINLHKILGGKTLMFDCGSSAENTRRLIIRGTPYLQPFVEMIPDWEETQKIALTANLALGHINTSGSLDSLTALAQRFNNLIGGTPWKIYSPELCWDI